jgi:xylulokinase
VAFSLRDSIEIFRELKIPLAQIRSSGGGSRNFTWREIQADIFGMELVTLRTSEGSAFGAALLAGVAAKTYSSVSEAAAEAIQVKESITPLAENVKAYDRYYQVYRDLYPAVRDLAHTLANLA